MHGSAQSTGQHLTAKNFRLLLSPTWVNPLRGLTLDVLLTIFCYIQSKKPNFDASHELEELLLEDNPLKAKARKQNRDINTLSNEMRQMEEQCVEPLPNHVLDRLSHWVLHRFTIYDFRAMRRRSYYPQNQQIVSTMTATSSLGVVPSRPVTPGDIINGRGDSVGLDSHSLHGLPEDYRVHGSEGHHHLQIHDINEKSHTKPEGMRGPH
jgi:hypothetical protein